MEYPINDIFEGVGDLLISHGNIKFSSHDLDANESDFFITYGGYNYKLVYIDGNLHMVNRIEKEADNGKD